MKTLILAILLLSLTAYGQAPPIVRSPMTTNAASADAPINGDSPVFSSGHWDYSPAAVANFATNATTAVGEIYSIMYAPLYWGGNMQLTNTSGIVLGNAAPVQVGGNILWFYTGGRNVTLRWDTNVTTGTGIMLAGTNMAGSGVQQAPFFVVNTRYSSNLVIAYFTNANSSATNIVQWHGSNNTYSAIDPGGGLHVGSVDPVGAKNIIAEGLLGVRGGVPTLATNAPALITSATLTGNDTAMILSFVTSAGTQAASSNYFRITLSSPPISANPVIVTFSPYGTNGTSAASASMTRWTAYSTSTTIDITSNVTAPTVSMQYGLAIHVDRY